MLNLYKLKDFEKVAKTCRAIKRNSIRRIVGQGFTPAVGD